jgi:phosphatidylglycerophosphate synthase
VIDRRLRQLAGPPLDRLGVRLATTGVRPLWLTAAGWMSGVAACVAAAFGAWSEALAAWLVNRALDGLDGPVARARGAARRGAFADLVADFSVYGGFAVGVAVALPAARLACVALLAACYVSGAAYVALSSLLERRLAGGVAEGAETIVAYGAVCVIPSHAALILWVFAALVAVTVLQRVAVGLCAAAGNVPAPHPSTVAEEGPADG